MKNSHFKTELTCSRLKGKNSDAYLHVANKQREQNQANNADEDGKENLPYRVACLKVLTKRTEIHKTEESV